MEIEEERHDEVMDMIKHSISKHKPWSSHRNIFVGLDWG
jgi:hypothetical protein